MSLLTGNQYVDTGLATVAALGNCKNIEDLTLRKMKYIHGNGMKLARNNERLRSTHSLFLDSMLTNPSYNKNPNKLKNYAKITTAILENVGHEENDEFCDICGNESSVDLGKIFDRTLKNKDKKKTKKFIGRDWFPLVGSMGSDAQALPGGSRSLNMCAKCLFAVQYLPQVVFSTKGMPTIFQSSSTTFWYRLQKKFVDDIRKRLAVKSIDKVETIGSGKDKENIYGLAAINRMLVIMKDLQYLDPNASLRMWMFVNGKKADCDKEKIPNFTLNFLYEVAKNALDEEIRNMICKEKNYEYSLFNCITKRKDYLPLYPSKKFDNKGASPEFFMLFQTDIRGYSVKSLHTAYKLSQYVNSKIDDMKLGIDIDKLIQKQTRVKEKIVEMITEGKITFDEYYDLFVSGRLDNPWRLIKYYMLTDVKNFKAIKKDEISSINIKEYKDKVVSIAEAIYNLYKDKERFEREVLGGLKHNHLHNKWLRRQFEILAEENEAFDLDGNWKALCINKQGEEDIYGLCLFRLLWSKRQVFIQAL